MVVAKMHLLYWLEVVTSEMATLPLVTFYLSTIVLYKQWYKLVPIMKFQPGVLMHYCVCGVLNAVCVLGLVHALAKDAPLVVLSRKESHQLSAYFTLFLVCKLIELLDTVYLLLSRRSREVTVVHVYEHSLLVIAAEHCQRRAPWPLFAFPAIISCFMHVFTYLFKLEKAIWPVSADFARRIDQLRTVHFFGLLVYAVYACHMRALSALVPPVALVSMLLSLAEYYWMHIHDGGAAAAKAIQQAPKLANMFLVRKDHGSAVKRPKVSKQRSIAASKKNR